MEGVLAHLPAAKGASSVIGEVDFADGLSVKVFGEGGLDLGEAVKPGKQGACGLGLEEAVVELVADFEGEKGEFTLHNLYEGMKGET